MIRTPFVAASFCGTLFLSILTQAHAEVKVPAVFSDGMILQRDQKVPIWGTAAPGEDIKIKIATQSKSGKAGPDGKWKILLDPLNAGSKGEMVIEGTNKISIKDVLVGEVWFCAGQSNMDGYAYHLKPEERGTKDYPEVRYFVAKKDVAPEPLTDVPGKWATAGISEQTTVSAVGYRFARELHERLKVPVGIVQSTWGDTRAENWTPMAAIRANPTLMHYVDQWEKEKHAVTNWVDYTKVYGDWAATKQGPEPIKPQKSPSALYNSMIAPLIPYGVKGILWYQGESNGWQGADYKNIFPTMITSWRKEWGNDNLPFLFVQLPGYENKAETPPSVSPWSITRESQEYAVKSLPAVEMAVTIDIGDKDIHPRNKPEVARRLMLLARALVYGEKNLVYTGPRFSKAEIKGDKVIISFDHTEGGLKIQGATQTAPGGKLKGFAVAGADRKWYWADAKIDKDKVVVRASEVNDPVAVRYAWAHNIECNLANGSDLPAAPFRTDTW